MRPRLQSARCSQLIVAFTFGIVAGCQAPYVVKEPAFGDSEYANFHNRHCRKDITEIRVETDVAAAVSTVHELVGRAKPHLTQGLEIVAVRMNRHRSDLNKLPTIEVVAGSYNWADSGLAWGGVQQMTIFEWGEDGWSLQETVTQLYDPI